MKHLVETSGEFMLVDPYSRTTIDSNRPTIVPVTVFIKERVATGEITLLVQDLPEEADDYKMYEFILEAGDTEVGVAAYLATFGLDAIGRPIETETQAKKQETLTLSKKK